MTDFTLSDEAEAIRAEVRRFATRELRPRARQGGDPAVLAELRASFRELGLGSVDWPEEAGGLGLGLLERVLVAEELAAGDAGLALALDDGGLAARALLELGSPAQRERLAALEDSGAVFALALDEADLAWERGALYTMASPDGEGWRLQGGKHFVLQAPRATAFVVLARTGFAPGWGEVDAFLVEAGAEGLQVLEDPPRIGLDALGSGRLLCAGCPAARLAGGAPRPAAIARLRRYRRILFAALMVGVARAATGYACGYAQERPAFGKMIGQFQGIAFPLAELATAVDATRWLVWRAAEAFDRGDADELPSLEALLTAQETVHRAGIDSVQVLGGAGFMEDYPVEKWMRDGAALAGLAGSRLVTEQLAADALFGPA